MTIDTRKFPVMKKMCKTCPFLEQHSGQTEIANMVRERSLRVSQVCHHPRLKGKQETHLCRGARDYQLMPMHRAGVIEDETDETWDKKRKELGV